MKNSLSARLTYRIMGVLLVMMAVIAGVVYVTVKEYMLNEAKERYRNMLLNSHEELRRHLSDVLMTIVNNVHDIERDIDYPDKMFEHVERIVRNNRQVDGCAILFKSGYFPNEWRVFIPFARRDSMGRVSVTRIDSTYHSELYDKWFPEQLKKDKREWTKAYFESEKFAGNQERRLLTTFTSPLHNRAGEPVALLCADLSLEFLRKEMMEDVRSMNDQFKGDRNYRAYSFVIDDKGTYIIHPDKMHMLRESIESDIRMPDEKGTTIAVIEGKRSWIYYRKVVDVNWTMAVVVPENVILFNGRMLNIIILLTMVIGLAAIYLICRYQIKEIADPFAAQKAAVDRELKIAHDIQMSMLPSSHPLPLPPHLDLYASLTPARDVGGDFYDYFVRDNCLFFCIGDVSGKGVPAALVMAMARSAFRLLAENESEPNRIVDSLNDRLARDNDLSFFITFFVGILDFDTGRLRFCNAGHKAPYILSKETITVLPVDKNLPVAAMHDWEFTSQETVLAPGTTLFLYTDGIDEAEDAQHKMFGKQRIQETLHDAPAAPQGLIEHMQQAVAGFVGDNEQSDDLTMLAIRYDEN